MTHIYIFWTVQLQYMSITTRDSYTKPRIMFSDKCQLLGKTWQPYCPPCHEKDTLCPGLALNISTGCQSGGVVLSSIDAIVRDSGLAPYMCTNTQTQTHYLIAIPSAFRVSFRESTLWRSFLPSLTVSSAMVTVYSETSPVGWISTANLRKQRTFYYLSSLFRSVYYSVRYNHRVLH